MQYMRRWLPAESLLMRRGRNWHCVSEKIRKSRRHWQSPRDSLKMGSPKLRC